MNLKALSLTALFAAFIALLGFLPPVFVPFFPLVPLTLHSLGPILAGAVLGAERGFYAVALFWLLLLAGLVFAAGSTGPAVFLGPTGGYIIGFGLAAFIIGALYSRFPPAAKRSPFLAAAQEFCFLAIGSLSIYAAGIFWLMILTKMSLTQAIWLNLLFIPGDCVKIILCIIIRRRLLPLLPAASGTLR